MYNITLPKTDIYFSYWLAHLIPLYMEQNNNIYQANKRLISLLPNFPLEHSIHIGSRLFEGKTKAKNIFEYCFGSIWGRLLEKVIKLIWLPIVLYKTKKHQED